MRSPRAARARRPGGIRAPSFGWAKSVAATRPLAAASASDFRSQIGGSSADSLQQLSFEQGPPSPERGSTFSPLLEVRVCAATAKTRRGVWPSASACMPRSLKSRREPATRSTTVRDTSTSPLRPSDATRAAIAATSPSPGPSVRSHSPVCRPTVTGSPSRSDRAAIACPHRIARAGPSKAAKIRSASRWVSVPLKRWVSSATIA